MEKKRYTVYLNVETTEELKQILAASGQGLSGFLSGMIDEYVETMQGLKKMAKVPACPGEVTVAQAVKMFSGIMSKWAKEKKTR
jgi:hypothetical protein